MKTIISDEVSAIYKQCGLSVEKDFQPRTTINVGNMHNRLNIKFNSTGRRITFENNALILTDTVHQRY